MSARDDVPIQPHATRRAFLSGAVAAAALGGAALARPQQTRDRPAGGPVAIASGNGPPATRRAVQMLRDGADPLDAVVEGVRIVEDDPNDMSVGLGGLPNEHGVVQLDASVMHGPTHRAGAVGALENVRNAAAVAREVARRTDHVMLVGAGALDFARKMGFQEENLLTDKARRAWLRWRASLNERDDWLDKDQHDVPGDLGLTPAARGADAAHPGDVMHTWGTIHCAGVAPTGDLAACTTTSGLSWKLPGRVGDSPIIGAGLYADNDIGAAGATGRGEAAIQVCAARTVVMRLQAGDHPTDACLHTLRLVARKTFAPRLLERPGRPNFQLKLYALRKDGVHGSAAMRPNGAYYAVTDADGDRKPDCAVLFE